MCYFVVKKQSFYKVTSQFSICGKKPFWSMAGLERQPAMPEIARLLQKEGRRKYIGCKRSSEKVVTVFSWRYMFRIFLPLIFTNNATGTQKMTDERDANFFLKKLILDFEILWYDQLHRWKYSKLIIFPRNFIYNRI